MITQTMSPEEIKEAVLADYAEVFYYSDTKDSAFRKRVKKASVFPVRAYSLYTSKSKNTWMILFEALSRKHVNDNAFLKFICYANFKNGYHVYFITRFKNNETVLAIYPPHFFQRYAQRNKVDKSGLELIRHYMERNYNSMIFAEEVDEQELLQGTTEEGISLGLKISEKVFVYKTFISWDMSFEDQKKHRIPFSEALAELKKEEDEIVRKGLYT